MLNPLKRNKFAYLVNHDHGRERFASSVSFLTYNKKN